MRVETHERCVGPSTPDVVWFRCIGCGEPACYFLREQGGTPAGAVGHSKPMALIGVAGSVPCELYKGTKPSRYWALHAGAERIEPPDTFEPAGGG